MSQPKLLIVIASTRPGRIGLPIGQWFAQRAKAHGGFEVVVADMGTMNLPFMDEPNHPRLRQYVHQHTKDWSAMVDSADAIVFVTPEYNYSIVAPLKNAIDFLFQEWAYKPVGMISYGGMSGGLRAATMTRQVVTVLKMIPISETVAIPFVGQMMKDGEFTPNEQVEKSATTMLDELLRIAPLAHAMHPEAAAS